MSDPSVSARSSYGRGLLAAQAGDWPSAVAHLRAAARGIVPNPAHWNSLGVAYLALGRAHRAAACFRRALRPAYDDPAILHHFARALWAIDKRREAVDVFARAVSLAPHDVDTLAALAQCLSKLNRIVEAAAVSRRILELDPANYAVASNLGGLLADQGLIHEACLRYATVAAQSRSAALHSNLLLTLHYGGFTPSQIFAEHRNWAALHYPAPTRTDAPAGDRSRRLRIGYVSSDFRDHSVAFLIEPILANHDPEAIETFLYFASRHPDAVTDRIRAGRHHWREIAALDDDAAAALIRSDAIDILVDLNGHTAGNRLGVFARKPAPVQVTYCGYPNTTGLAAIDYRITDGWCDPPGPGDALHSERLCRLAPGFLAYRPPDYAPPVSPLPALRNGYITYGAFAVRPKITEPMLAAWREILRREPGARLIVKNRQVEDTAIAAALGLDPARVEFRGNSPRADHILQHHDIDIMLDTFPYNGTVMSCESLWMGVPLVTLAGESHVSRVGVSLLERLGLRDWIATSFDDYVDRAVTLGRDLDRLAELRSALRPRFAASTLGDPRAVTRALEDAYRAMWSRRLAAIE